MRLRNLAVISALVPLLAACDDDFNQSWSALPDTVLLYSVSRPELIGQPSAYDFYDGVPFVVENPTSTGRWDVVLVDQGNTLALVPASAFNELDTRAGIATIGAQTLEEVETAPRDTSLYSRQAVPMQLGTVYVIRSRRVDCGIGTGVRYGKFEPLEIDVAAGTLLMRAVLNPFCSDRKLIPPD